MNVEAVKVDPYQEDKRSCDSDSACKRECKQAAVPAGAPIPLQDQKASLTLSLETLA